MSRPGPCDKTTETPEGVGNAFFRPCGSMIREKDLSPKQRRAIGWDGKCHPEKFKAVPGEAPCPKGHVFTCGGFRLMCPVCGLSLGPWP